MKIVRDLPKYVLRPEYRTKTHLEAESVQMKFSQASARFGDENVDYVALTYLSPEAALYWLPRLIEFLMSKAPRDNLHFEQILSYLVREENAAQVRAIASENEIKLITDYLEWYYSTLDDREKPILGRSVPHAVALWQRS